jgi:hypothetical protein
MSTRDGRGPVRVGNLLTKAVPALAERLLEEAIRREWSQTIGPEAARRSRPMSLRKGTLEISADNSPWLQELTLRSAAIAATLRERHGSAVSGVRFVLATTAPGAAVPDPHHSRTPVSSRQLSAEEARQVDDAARRLADHGLATSLRRLLTKDLLARGERRASAASEQS